MKRGTSGVVRLIVIMVCMVVLLMGFTAINAKKHQDNGYKLTKENIAEAEANMGDDIFAGEMYIDGVRYQMPIAMQDLITEGWQINDAYTYSRTTVPANGAFENYISVESVETGNNQLLEVALANPSSEDVALEEALIYDINFAAFRGNKIVLPKGITLSSAMEEVKAAYGEPTSESIKEVYATLRTTMEYSMEGIIVTFIFEAEENEAPKMENFIYKFDI